MAVFVWGLVFFAAPFFPLRAILRRGHALRKERFERTNSSGIAEFKDFEEATRFEQKEATTEFLLRTVGVACIFVMLFGAALLLYSIFGGRRY